MKRPVRNTMLSLLAVASLLLTSFSAIASERAANNAAPASRPKASLPRAGSVPHRKHSDLEPSLQEAFVKAVYRPDRAANGVVNLDNPTQRFTADLTREGLRVRTGPASS